MFLIAIVKVMGMPGGTRFPLSGFTVTSMSGSVQAIPLAEVDGLAEVTSWRSRRRGPEAGR